MSDIDTDTESDVDTANAAGKQDKQPWLKKYRWPKGVSGNPAGKEPGTLSPKARIRQMFNENPEDFDEWLQQYLNDPNNRRHAIELLDGKPSQSHDVNLTLPQFMIDLIKDNGSTNQG